MFKSRRSLIVKPEILTLAVFVLATILMSGGPHSRVVIADHGTGTGQSFTFLQAGFTQDVFGVSSSFAGGVAFAPDGDPLIDNCAFSGSPLHRYDRQGVGPVVNGTNLHPETILSSNAGCGLTNHPDGNLYTNTSLGVIRLNADTGAQIGNSFGPSGNALGIAPDPQTGNLVYVGNDGTIRFVDPAFTTSGVFSTVTTGNFVDGIFFDPTGNFLFLANRNPSFRLTILNRSGGLVQHVPMTSEPDGIAFHADAPQFVVTVNTDGTITRFDFPGNDFTLPPALSLFASGGFRGDLSQVGPDGCLYLTQDGTRYDNGVVTSQNSLVRICGGFAPPPGVEPCEITCPSDISVGNTPGLCGTIVSYSTPDATAGCGTVECAPPSGSFFPVGTTTVTCAASDSEGGESTCAFSVTVTDVQPPSITASLTASPLWPPNHNMVNVGSFSVSDNCSGNLTVAASITQDEPLNTTGDGNFQPDAAVSISGSNPKQVSIQLRRERQGNGNGRVYLIKVTATDASGNTTTRCATVTVPRDQSNASVSSVANQAASALAACQAGGTMLAFNSLAGPPVGPKQ